MPLRCSLTRCLLCDFLLLTLVLRLPGSAGATVEDGQARTTAEFYAESPTSSADAFEPTSSLGARSSLAGLSHASSPHPGVPSTAAAAADPGALPSSSLVVGKRESDRLGSTTLGQGTATTGLPLVSPSPTAGNVSSNSVPSVSNMSFTTTTPAPSNCSNISTLVFQGSGRMNKSVQVPQGCECLLAYSVLPEASWHKGPAPENQPKLVWLQSDDFWGRMCVTFRCGNGTWSVPLDIASDNSSHLQVDLGPLRSSSLHVTWSAAPPPLDDSNSSTSSEAALYVTKVTDIKGEHVCTVSAPACPKGSDSNSSSLNVDSSTCSLMNWKCTGTESMCSKQCNTIGPFQSQINCSFVIQGLRPWTSYSIAFTDPAAAAAEVSPIWKQTDDIVPGHVQKIDFHPIKDDAGYGRKQVKVSWVKPQQVGGQLWYLLSWRKRSDLESFSNEEQQQHHLIVDIEFDIPYLFKVEACSTAGCSHNSTEYTLRPGKPKPIEQPKQPKSHLIDVTTRSIQFSMVNPYTLFDAAAGNITPSFDVALVRGQKSYSNSIFSKCCPDSHSGQHSEHPCVLWDRNEASRLQVDHTYDVAYNCKGLELLPDTDYCLFIIGYTSSGQNSSSYCFVVAHTHPAPDLAAIVVPVFVLLLLVAAVIVVLLLRRKKVLRFRLPWERISRRRSHHDLELTRRRLTAKQILLKDFGAHVAKMHENSNLGFSHEFHDIKCVSPKHPFDTAIYAGNLGKNRYADIMPFDHSRVHLITNDEDEYDGSDYINANYVPGFNSPREYIATQGPLPSTIGDFWRMVWEQNIPTIVMLTSLVERGNTKCERYWPDAQRAEQLSNHSHSDDGEVGTCRYGDICVTPIDFKTFDSYELTVLEIQQMSVKKRVNHFYYRLWPDMSCPHDKEVFVDFVEQVRESHLPGGNARHAAGPMLVHCSAGVGRTGTFIAVDVLLQKILIQSSIDVPGEVMNLREHRCRMVQTEDQYIFIHDCIANAINLLESSSAERPCNGTSRQAAGHSPNGRSPRPAPAAGEQGDVGQQQHSLARRAGAVKAAAAGMNGSPAALLAAAAAAARSREPSSSDGGSSSESEGGDPRSHRSSLHEEEGPLLQPDLQQLQRLEA